MRRIVSLTFLLFLLYAPAVEAAEVSVQPQTCSGAVTFTQVGTDWKAVTPCTTTIYSAAEAKEFADLVKPDPAPDPPPPPGPDAPTLTNPVTITLSPTAKTASKGTGTDCIVQASGPLPGGVRVDGCHNIIARGLRINGPMVPNATGSAFALARRALQFVGYSGHLYVDDLRIAGDIAEGVQFNTNGAAGTKATFYNVRCELVTRAYSRSVNGVFASRAPTWPNSYSVGQATYDGLAAFASGSRWDEHGDCFQSWAMPQSIYMEKVTGVTPTQFMYLEPDSTGRTLTMKDVNARQYTAPWDGSKVTDQYFWAEGWATNLTNVWGEGTRTERHGVPYQNGVPPLGDFVP